MEPQSGEDGDVAGRKTSIVKDEKYIQDNYIKIGKMGSGGFGVVWKGFRLADSMPVAIKEIPLTRVNQWGKWFGESVPMEAVFLLKLKRVEGVIQLIDLGKDRDKFVIVMERPKASVDLFDYITDRRRLDGREARQIFKSVFKILDRCRHRGVFHGDLKDENILIDVGNKNVKLIDFGGAMKWTDKPYRKFLGTRLWSPPECDKREAFQAEAATVWSLGCLLHTMLTGDIPFDKKPKSKQSELEIHAAEIRDDMALDLIVRCLAFDARKRLTLNQVRDHPWFKDSRMPNRSIARDVHRWQSQINVFPSPRVCTPEEWFRARQQGHAGQAEHLGQTGQSGQPVQAGQAGQAGQLEQAGKAGHVEVKM